MVWKLALSAIVQWLLMLIFAPLVRRGIIPQELLDRLLDEGTQQVVAGLIALGVLAWQLRVHIIAVAKVVIAAAKPEETPVREVDRTARQLSFREKLWLAINQQAR
jgi:hypothetical protein